MQSDPMKRKKNTTLEQLQQNTNQSTANSRSTFFNICCICRKGIESKDDFVYCSNCKVKFHRKHLTTWLKIKNKCPICNITVSLTEILLSPDNYTLTKTNKEHENLNYKCSHCNYQWNTKQQEKQIWCPNCKHTRCPHCYSTFHFSFILDWLSKNDTCPTCKKHLKSHDLVFRIENVTINRNIQLKDRKKEMSNYKKTRKNRYSNPCPRCSSKLEFKKIRTLPYCPECGFHIIYWYR